MGPRLSVRRPPLLTVALVLALLVTALWWQLAERRARIEAARAGALVQRVESLADSLRLARNQGPEAASGTTSRLDDGDLRVLRDLGLSNPVHDLLADLEKHPELIPFKGVLGGTMFFSASESAVLSPNWVLGYFEDGHIGGHCLLEYRVQPGGHVFWKRLAAKLD